METRLQFYVLRPDGGLFGTQWAFADRVEPVNLGDPGLCPVCQQPVAGFEWLPPHRITLSSAHPWKWGDFLFGAGFTLMVSERFKQLYEAEQLQGIKAFAPVEVVRAGHGKNKTLPSGLPQYFLADIEWNGANLDDRGSEADRRGQEKQCTYCRGGNAPAKLNRLAFVPDSWNGADIFIARGAPGWDIVSARFKHVFEQGELKNAEFIPADQVQYDESIIPDFGSGIS